MQGQGSSTSLRIGFETSFGIKGGTAYEVPFMPTLDIKETQNLNDSAVIRGTRNMDKSFLGFKAVDGSVSVPVDTKTTPKWLKGFLGDAVTTGTGPYTHVFKIQDLTIPSLFVEVAHEDLSLFYLHNGIKCNSFDVSFGGDGELMMNINLMGQKTTKATSQAVAPTAITGNTKFEQFQAAITGASSVKDFSINYTNNLDGSQYTIGDGGVRGEIPLGMAGVSGSFTALFENSTLLDAAKANTTQSLTVTLTNGANSIEFDLEEVTLEPTGVSIDSPQGLSQTFNYTAFWNAGTNASALQVTVVNDSATV